jgi:hypothetical protein
MKSNQVKFIEAEGEPTQLQLDLNISNDIATPKKRNIFANLLMNDAIKLGEAIAVMTDAQVEEVYGKLNPHPQTDAPPIIQDTNEAVQESRIITL